MLHWRSVVFGFVLGLALIATRGWAKGEFYREVPRSWVPAALCVHQHEAAWNNPGVYWTGAPSPYYGGMSMDISFQRSYGGWILSHHGTANHWNWRTQLLVAYRGYRVRGWQPWFNTAHACRLI